MPLHILMQKLFSKASIRWMLFAVLLSVVGMFAGCAGGAAPAVEPSAEVIVEAPRDSLRAKFLLTIVGQDGKPQELDAVLFSVPGKRYRMELTGPMGIGVASMLWTEQEWLMTFPTEKLYMKGAGYMVGLLNDNSLPLVHIHQVANLFEGILLPENFEEVDVSQFHGDVPQEDGGQVHYGKEPSGRIFAYGVRDSSVVWLNRPGRDGVGEMLRFSEFKAFEGVNTPSSIVFEKNGVRFLEIKIRKVTRNKPFSLGTWRLNVPRSFTLVN